MRATIAAAALLAIATVPASAEQASTLPDVVQGRWYPTYWSCGSAASLKGGIVLDTTSLKSTTEAYACTFEKIEPAKMAPPDAVGEWTYRKTCILNLPEDHGTQRQYGWMRVTVGKDGQRLEANDADNESGLFEAPVNPTLFEGRRCP